MYVGLLELLYLFAGDQGHLLVIGIHKEILFSVCSSVLDATWEVLLACYFGSKQISFVFYI